MDGGEGMGLMLFVFSILYSVNVFILFCVFTRNRSPILIPLILLFTRKIFTSSIFKLDNILHRK